MVACVAALLGIVAVLAGLWCTAESIVELIASPRYWDLRSMLFGVVSLAGGIAVLDVLMNRWPGGKIKIDGRKP